MFTQSPSAAANRFGAWKCEYEKGEIIMALKLKSRLPLWAWITISIVVVAISCVIYVSIGKNAREKYVMEYLENRGYSQSQILSIKAQHSFLDIILGYKEWGVKVVFSDEPDTTYSYSFDSKKSVRQGSVSYKDINTKIEDLKHTEK